MGGGPAHHAPRHHHALRRRHAAAVEVPLSRRERALWGRNLAAAQGFAWCDSHGGWRRCGITIPRQGSADAPRRCCTGGRELPASLRAPPTLHSLPRGSKRAAAEELWNDLKRGHFLDSLSRVLTITLQLKSNHAGVRYRLILMVELTSTGTRTLIESTSPGPHAALMLSDPGPHAALILTSLRHMWSLTGRRGAALV